MFVPRDVISRLQQLNCEDVANDLGLSVNKHKAKCFMHNDSHPSLSFHKSGKFWKCFVCDKGGDSISLVQEYFEITRTEACEWLCQRHGILINQRRIPYRKFSRLQHCSNVKANETPSAEFKHTIGEWIISNASLSIEAKKFLFDERKLDPFVIDRLNIRSITYPAKLVDGLSANFSSEELVEAGYIKINNGKRVLRLFTPCILFPYYDRNGQLCGLQSRYIGEKKEAPRFQFVANSKTRLFNRQSLNQLQLGDTLHVSEGITDCLALLSDGYNAVAIPSATTFVKEDIRELVPYKIVMSVDRDAAGEKAYQSVCNAIIGMGGIIRRMDFPGQYKDYGEYHKQNR